MSKPKDPSSIKPEQEMRCVEYFSGSTTIHSEAIFNSDVDADSIDRFEGSNRAPCYIDLVLRLFEKIQEPKVSFFRRKIDVNDGIPKHIYIRK